VRPLAHWPLFALHVALRFSMLRHLWTDAIVEIHRREVVEPALAACNNESGPWLCAPVLERN
jgi:hypothetical protein